ncbi:Nuclear transport factor 2 family protein OS=Streptomyces rimosus subsp. rimosus (strain ATCC/ DSM 40260 / JCM 4667 / NRRL 2234) OX=1265868 GN=SRIM_026395 PE=4 SV=1 [Streptomyces rimosus subsp. rimosus]
MVYGDGTPRTQHVTSNVAIEVDERGGYADARSYVTVFQALPELPLQAIAAGRYRDRFERRGGRWRFAGAAGAVVGSSVMWARHLRGGTA